MPGNLPIPGSRVILHWHWGDIFRGELLRREIVNEMIAAYNRIHPPQREWDEDEEGWIQYDPEWEPYSRDPPRIHILVDDGPGRRNDGTIRGNGDDEVGRMLSRIVTIPEGAMRVHAENESCPSCRRE